MLAGFFTPESVAVVGVSLKGEKLGNQILKNILKGNFKGKVFPVNKKATEKTFLDGLKVYPDLTFIPEKVDLCIIVVPAPYVNSVIEKCGEKGIKSAAVISAGFKETGEEGKKLEKELVRKAREKGIKILGPNILGVINTSHNLNASFAPTYPPAGNIGLIFQSGALGCAFLDQCQQEGVGISKFISLGNKADLDEVDFISFLGDDPDTEVILGYLESINRGKEFIKVAKQVARKKPIIMIKSGRSKAGRKAASSHTGALSGEDEAFDVAFKEAGIIRAKTVAEAFEMARGFSSGKLPKGEKVLLVTNAGGAGIMATDACEDYSVKLTSLSENTVARLKERLPEASSISNPLDILGDAEPERYEFTLKEVLSDPNVDVVSVILTPQITTRPAEVALRLKEISENSEKPILCCFMGGEIVEPAISILNKAKIPNYKDPDAMAKVLRGMISYTAGLRQEEEEKVEKVKADKQRAEKILLLEKNKGNLHIGGLKALKIMKAYRIPVVESYLAKTVEEALTLTHKMKEPFVLKIESAEIVHKSDVGGVKVGVRKEQVEDTFSEIMENARKVVKDREKIEGILVQPLVKWGREILIGAIKDSTFGHLIRFGLGGKYVELFRDFSTRLVPLSKEKAKKMIEETKIASKFLQGFRDEPAADAEIVIDSLLRLSQLVLDFPWIQEIEANPFVVWEKGGVVVDARIKIS